MNRIKNLIKITLVLVFSLTLGHGILASETQSELTAKTERVIEQVLHISEETILNSEPVMDSPEHWLKVFSPLFHEYDDPPQQLTLSKDTFDHKIPGGAEKNYFDLANQVVDELLNLNQAIIEAELPDKVDKLLNSNQGITEGELRDNLDEISNFNNEANRLADQFTELKRAIAKIIIEKLEKNNILDSTLIDVENTIIQDTFYRLGLALMDAKAISLLVNTPQDSAANTCANVVPES